MVHGGVNLILGTHCVSRPISELKCLEKLHSVGFKHYWIEMFIAVLCTYTVITTSHLRLIKWLDSRKPFTYNSYRIVSDSNANSSYRQIVVAVNSNSLYISLMRKWQLFKLDVFWMSSLVCILERKEYCVGSRSWSRYWRTWFGLCSTFWKCVLSRFLNVDGVGAVRMSEENCSTQSDQWLHLVFYNCVCHLCV